MNDITTLSDGIGVRVPHQSQAWRPIAISPRSSHETILMPLSMP